MKINREKKKQARAAYALMTVMVIGGISLAVYASAAKWTANSLMLNDRNNVYNSTVAAAEGATEQVLAFLEHDFAHQSYDPTKLDRYRALVPTNDWASAYQFSDGQGEPDHVYVSGGDNKVMTNLNSQFAGLYGLAYACTVRADAKALNSPYYVLCRRAAGSAIGGHPRLPVRHLL